VRGKNEARERAGQAVYAYENKKVMGVPLDAAVAPIPMSGQSSLAKSEWNTERDRPATQLCRNGGLVRNEGSLLGLTGKGVC